MYISLVLLLESSGKFLIVESVDDKTELGESLDKEFE